MATIPTLASYNINPATQFGSGTYGAVPGAIGLPPSTYSQVSSLVPGLATSPGLAASNISSELAGQVPSDVEQEIQNAAATYGVTSGMPGSGLAKDLSLESLGITSLQLQQEGLTDYLKMLTGVGGTTLQPGLISGIASQNAMMTAAPNPMLAASTLTGLATGAGVPRTSVPGVSGGGMKMPGPTSSQTPGYGLMGYNQMPGGSGTFQDDTWYGASGATGTAGSDFTAALAAYGTGAGAMGTDEDFMNWLYGGDVGAGGTSTATDETGSGGAD